jgi:hypothetical protein
MHAQRMGGLHCGEVLLTAPECASMVSVMLDAPMSRIWMLPSFVPTTA